MGNIKNLYIFKRALLLMDFDVIDIYLTVLADVESIYLKSESPYGFTKDMNDEVVNAFQKQSFTNCSAFFWKK